ncbi:hypothetical protein N665_0668s0019 [Sinapis alba]|nr:hypothetical protein N665_0668s0019 [Sinapis alba]
MSLPPRVLWIKASSDAEEAPAVPGPGTKSGGEEANTSSRGKFTAWEEVTETVLLASEEAIPASSLDDSISFVGSVTSKPAVVSNLFLSHLESVAFTEDNSKHRLLSSTIRVAVSVPCLGVVGDLFKSCSAPEGEKIAVSVDDSVLVRVVTD